jgi:hypothetical protein
VLCHDLSILVKERVVARLGVLLEFGVILCPAVSGDLVQTSLLENGSSTRQCPHMAHEESAQVGLEP